MRLKYRIGLYNLEIILAYRSSQYITRLEQEVIQVLNTFHPNRLFRLWQLYLLLIYIFSHILVEILFL